MLTTTLLLGAASCGSRSPSQTVLKVEGGSDDDVRYSDRKPLPAPPKLGKGAPDASYLTAVAGKVQPAWASFLEDCRVRLPADHALNTSSLYTELVFVLNREGTIVEVKANKASGNAEFDQVAQEIAGDLGALPAPPEARVSDDERFYLHWGFARDVRQAGPKGGRWEHVELPLVEALPKLIAGKQYAKATERIMASGGSAADTSARLASVAKALVADGLASPDAEVQAVALRAVGAGKLKALLPNVRTAARSTEPKVALAAIEAMASVGEEEDTALLVSFAHGASAMPPVASAAAAEAAARLGRSDEVRAKALGDLSASEAPARAAALAVFSVLPAEESVKPLSAIALGNRDASRAERAAAAKALGFQAAKARRAVKSLLAGTSEADAAVRFACTDALAYAAKNGLRSRVAYWRSLELIKDKDERVRAAAVRAAAGLDPARFGKELGAIRTGGSKLVLASMAEALGSVPGTTALARLVDLSAVSDASMRVWAARGLAQRSEPKAAAALEKLLGDESFEVRLAAMQTAGPEKLRTLLEDSSPEVQARAFMALSKREGRAKTAPRLAQALSNPDLPLIGHLRWAGAWLGAQP